MRGSLIEAVVANAEQPRGRARIPRAFCHPRTTIILVMALGVGLRVWAYVRDTSLYLDEILLSRNILQLPLRQLLTKPLALDQVAPRGFLLIERLAVTIFGPSELALRLLPFVCGIGSIVLFWRLAERILTAAGSAIALFLFAIGVPFIRFGAEVKQYECDLLAAVVLPLLVLRLLEREASATRHAMTGLAGFVVIWFSQASVLVMAGLGVAMALEWLASRERKTAHVLLFTISLWAVASMIAVVAAECSMTPSTRQYMNDFWHGAFFPLPFRLGTGAIWVGQRFAELFSDATLLRYRWPIVFALVAATGIVVVWKRSRLAAWLLCGPAIVALAAAIAQQYPFRGRLALWLLPAAVLALAAGADWIRAQASALHPAVGVLVVLAHTTSGGCSTVGLAGLALGGGQGKLMGKYGAACNNLTSAQLVTVDGQQVEAREKSNPDRWAIRGRGGNFGVVTALEYQLHSVTDVLAGTLMYPPGRIPELLLALVEFVEAEPDEMDVLAQLLPSEKGPRCRMDFCYCGDPRSGNDLLRPLRALKPQEDNVRITSYLTAQSAGGFLQTPVAHFQTNQFFPQLSPTIEAIAAAISDVPQRGKVIVVPLRGAISRVSPMVTQSRTIQ